MEVAETLEKLLVSLLEDVCKLQRKVVALHEAVRVSVPARPETHALLFSPQEEAGLAKRIAAKVVSELGSEPLKPPDRKKHLREREVAEYLGVKVATLRAWRLRRSKHGPPFIRLGKMVLYSVAELETHIANHLVPTCR